MRLGPSSQNRSRLKAPLLCAWLVTLALVLVTVSASAADTLTIISRGDANAEYSIGLLKLALSKVEKHYRYDIHDGALTGARQKQNLIDGSVDVVWTATNQEMEDAVTPIRIPLYKGLLGYRVLLIHRDNNNLFSNTQSKKQLLQYTYGQGLGWSDTDIMTANGMTVITANKYESLFYMTDGKRFDAFPRGIHEPWLEMANRPTLDLTVDKTVMLIYKMPFYLFITPTKPALAIDVEKGMNIALDDGSFDEYFFNSPTVSKVLESVDLKSRQIFELNNPGLPPKTPIHDPRLWINLQQLQNSRL